MRQAEGKGRWTRPATAPDPGRESARQQPGPRFPAPQGPRGCRRSCAILGPSPALPADNRKSRRSTLPQDRRTAPDPAHGSAVRTSNRAAERSGHSNRGASAPAHPPPNSISPRMRLQACFSWLRSLFFLRAGRAARVAGRSASLRGPGLRFAQAPRVPSLRPWPPVVAASLPAPRGARGSGGRPFPSLVAAFVAATQGQLSSARRRTAPAHSRGCRTPEPKAEETPPYRPASRPCGRADKEGPRVTVAGTPPRGPNTEYPVSSCPANGTPVKSRGPIQSVTPTPPDPPAPTGTGGPPPGRLCSCPLAPGTVCRPGSEGDPSPPAAIAATPHSVTHLVIPRADPPGRTAVTPRYRRRPPGGGARTYPAAQGPADPHARPGTRSRHHWTSPGTRSTQDGQAQPTRTSRRVAVRGTTRGRAGHDAWPCVARRVAVRGTTRGDISNVPLKNELKTAPPTFSRIFLAHPPGLVCTLDHHGQQTEHAPGGHRGLR